MIPDDPTQSLQPSPLEVSLTEPKESSEFILYGLHGKGREYINFYDNKKEGYKQRSVAWLTSLLIALAFVAGHQQQLESIDKLYLISLLTLFAWIGIKFLRYLDINVYHTQLAEVYSAVYQMEEEHPHLTRSHVIMGRLLHGKFHDPILNDTCFYAALGVTVSLIGAAALFLKLDREQPIAGIITCFSIMGIFLLWEVVTFITSLRYGSARISEQRGVK